LESRKRIENWLFERVGGSHKNYEAHEVHEDWVNPAIRKSPAIKLKIFFIILIFSFKIGF